MADLEYPRTREEAYLYGFIDSGADVPEPVIRKEAYIDKILEMYRIDRDVNSVSPEMFGAKGDGINDDTESIQTAINTGKTVKLTKDYKITESLTDIGSIYFDGGSILIYSNVDGLILTGDEKSLYGHGSIIVKISGYTGAAVKIIGPSSGCNISGIVISGYSYSTPEGYGIYTESSAGRQFAHNIKCTVRNFHYGVYIDATKWSNNYYLDLISTYNDITVYTTGVSESSHHIAYIRGEAAYYTANGCCVREDAQSTGSYWDVQLFDTGNAGYNTKLLDLLNGYAILNSGDLSRNSYRGPWRSNFSPISVMGKGSNIEGCDSQSWVTKTLIGGASDMQNNPIMVFGNGANTGGALAFVGALNRDKGIRYTITLPSNINVRYFTLMAPASVTVPHKVILKCTGSGGTEEIEISGTAFANGRTFDAKELFTWKAVSACSKIELDVIGVEFTQGGSYTRLSYFGVFDQFGRQVSP